MPVKARTAKARRHRITPAAVEAFRAGDERALHRALDLRPWQPSPLEADADAPPTWSRPGTPWHDAWALVRGLRLELEAAAGVADL
jgi:hypothetical protein